MLFDLLVKLFLFLLLLYEIKIIMYYGADLVVDYQKKYYLEFILVYKCRLFFLSFSETKYKNN